VNAPVRTHRAAMQVLVMAKSPVAGRVKTRLCPPLSLEEAAGVARAALADTLDAVAACDAEVKIVALDGEPGCWLPDGIDVISQRGRGLAERLANAWADSRTSTGGWGLQIGMDTPQVTPGQLNGMLRVLRSQGPDHDARSRALLGPAVDGGWWVIGLPGTDPHDVFRDMPMSTPFTASSQMLRLRELGLDVVSAATSRDIDTVADLEAVAGLIPLTRTGAVAGRLLGLSSPAHAEAMVA
jgi:uncharacterized protein